MQIVRNALATLLFIVALVLTIIGAVFRVGADQIGVVCDWLAPELGIKAKDFLDSFIDHD